MERKKEMSILQTNYDVVIIGSGGAGMSAALEVAAAGLKPVILEKTDKVGGNTNKASSGMNASETIFQKEAGISDQKSAFFEESLKGGHGSNDQELLHYYIDHSAAAIEWLNTKGIVLDNLTITGGMSLPRTHRPHDGSAVGGYLVKGLKRNLEALEIPIVMGAEALHLILEKGRIIGLQVKQNDEVRKVACRAVILASGGFGANFQMIESVRPDLRGYITTSGSGITGDGIRLAEEAGGYSVDMGKIQVHPTVQQDQGILIGEAVRGEGAIMVDAKGRRFVNEMGTRDVVSSAITSLPEQKARLIFDQGVRERNKAIEFYDYKGYVIKGESVEDLAAAINVPAQAMKETLQTWNGFVDRKEDVAFQRTTGLHRLDRAPYYSIEIAPGIHYTMGGVKINTKAEVLHQGTQEPIPGLYACGEVVGGIHGSNRIGGNSIGEIIVFGRLAGQSASQYLQ